MYTVKKAKLCREDISKCRICNIIVSINDEIVNPHVIFMEQCIKFFICADCKYAYMKQYNSNEKKPIIIIDYC